MSHQPTTGRAAERRRRRSSRGRRPARPVPLGELAILGACLLLAALVVGAVQPVLSERHQQVRVKHDVYFLPPPSQVATLSLGYKAALADALWAHVLVSQGLHTSEKRRFENLIRLYDVINELDPSWRMPYLLADALITFQGTTTPVSEVIKAREILERGVKHRPHDAEIWLNLGQFVAFVAPSSYLEDTHPELAATWRIEGARMLARAAELGAGSMSYVSWQAVGGAGILEKAGERDAAIRFVQRALAVTDDEELKEYLLQRLQHLVGERVLDEHRRREEAFLEAARRSAPFLSRQTILELGPPPAPWHCAGPGQHRQPRCAPSWRQWAELHDTAHKAGEPAASPVP